jgi:hypothetical protein
MADTSKLNLLKDLIASVESINSDKAGDGYNAYNYGESGGSGISTQPPITSLTIKEIQDSQFYIKPINDKRLFAVGRYQLIPNTLKSAIEKLKLNPNQKLDKETQSKLGDWLVLEVKSNLGRYVKGINGGSKADLEDAVQALSNIFASFPCIKLDGTNYGDVETGKGDRGYYSGKGPNPKKTKITVKDVVLVLIKTRVEYSDKSPSYFPSYYNGPKGSSTPQQTKISGKVTDEKGNPISGVEVKTTPPKPIILGQPIKNPNTGKFEVKDQDGNVIADSIDGELARRQASDIVLNRNKQQSINNPPPPATTTPSTQGYSDTPFKTSAESDDFRRWLLDKYPNYGTRTDKYKVDPPPQPNYINTDALKKAWSEKGTEYNIINLKFDSSKEIDPSEVEEPVTVVTDKDGNWEIMAPSTFDPKSSTITFSKEGHEIREVTNIQQTGGDIIGEEGKQYDLPRITVSKTPDVTGAATNQLNQEILTEETKLIKQQGNSELSAQERLANSANNKKEELKKTAIPFIIKLLAPFGAVALQAVISKIPLDKIKDQIQCPSQAKILELTNKRNKLVRQVNNAYKTINTLTKTLSITSNTITAVQAGIATIEALPYPATGVPPIGLPPLTSGIIEVTGSGKDKLKEALKKANVIISIVTLSLAAFGAILGIILRLLNNLDALIQQCAQEQDVPFEDINNELNTFVNQSTGISNSEVIQSTQEDNTYKGFTLEIKLDETNSNKYPRRFAQALTKTGIPVLKTDSSFASDPQVLLDQLKFIIDSNPQLTAE